MENGLCLTETDHTARQTGPTALWPLHLSIKLMVKDRYRFLFSSILRFWWCTWQSIRSKSVIWDFVCQWSLLTGHVDNRTDLFTYWTMTIPFHLRRHYNEWLCTAELTRRVGLSTWIVTGPGKKEPIFVNHFLSQWDSADSLQTFG